MKRATVNNRMSLARWVLLTLLIFLLTSPALWAQTPPCDIESGALSADVASICQGGSVDITSEGTSGTVTYAVFENGVVVNTLATVEQVEAYFKTLAPGEYCIYTLAYTEFNEECDNIAGKTLQEIIDECLEGQCYDVSEELCITVNANPVSKIERIGPAESCEGDDLEIQVKMSATGGEGPYDFTYQINREYHNPENGCLKTTVFGNNMLVEGDPSATLDFTGYGPGTYTVILKKVVDYNDCEDDTERSVTFTIHEKPAFEAIPPKSIYTCTDVNVNLEAYRVSCDEVTYKWYSVATPGSTLAYNNPNVKGETGDPAGTSSTIDDVLTNLTNTKQTIYYFVEATTANGCKDSIWVAVEVRPKAELDCVGCGKQVNVTLDDKNCEFKVTIDMVLYDVAACARKKDIPLSFLYDALEVVIDDGKGGDNIVTCPGLYKYVVRLKPEYKSCDGCVSYCLDWQPCWGTILAEDKSGPLVDKLEFQCKRAALEPEYIDADNPGDLESFVTQESHRRGCYKEFAPAVFLCTDVNAVYNVAASWNNPNYAYFAGRPIFKDACSDCPCTVTTKVTDQVTFFPCTDSEFLLRRGIWAILERTFTGTDCAGNSTQVKQHIFFFRPKLQIDLYDEIVLGTSCTAPSTDEMIKIFKSKYYIFNNWLKCDDSKADDYAYFPEAVAAGNSGALLECNYSFDINVKAEFPVCGDGKKVEVEVRAFDWCRGKSILIDKVLLKWFDDKAPTFTMPDKPVVISTGPMDCTAAFGIDLAGLERFFGVKVTDNCSVPTVSVKIWTYGYEYVYGIPTGEEKWRQVDYQTMVMKAGDGKTYLMAVGVPIGKHKLYIEAFDGCYNKDDKWLEFEVADKIAPVMKCDDHLNVTLSNSQSNPYGNPNPGAGYAIDGYAQVRAADIDEGSWDNCGMKWIRARRTYNPACEASFIAKGYDSDGNGKIEEGKDGVDWNKDGDIDDFAEKFAKNPATGMLMTPALDIVEFFCCDLEDSVMVELWGEDIHGNRNYCWQWIYLEDKVTPTYSLPWDVEIKCDRKDWIALLTGAASYKKGSPEYQKIEDEILTKGDFVIMSGDDCRNVEVTMNLFPQLHCDAGLVEVSWTWTKKTSKGTITGTTPKVTITVKEVHQYDICFPEDMEGYCGETFDSSIVIDEHGCDVLAVNVTDKRYNASESGAECYKIFRTYTVLNWCQYDDQCGEPMQWAVIVPSGTNVLVRDEFAIDGEGNEVPGMDGIEEIYFDYNDKVPFFDERVYGFEFNNKDSEPCPETEEIFAWMSTQIIKVYDDEQPEVEIPELQKFPTNGSTCRAEVSIPIRGYDNCTPLVELEENPGHQGNIEIERVRLETDPVKVGLGTVELSALGTYGLSGVVVNAGPNSWEFRGFLPEGNHALIVIIRDECGNLSKPTRIPFTVADCKAPVPICHNGLSTKLMKDPVTGEGMMVIWASDFVASNIYDCSGQGPETDPANKNLLLVRKYWLVADRNANGFDDETQEDPTGRNGGRIPIVKENFLTLTCEDAKLTQLLVRLYAEDAEGNMDWCETYLIVGDQNKICGPGSSSSAIDGSITTEGKEGIEEVEVNLSGDASKTGLTGTKGNYAFPALNQGYDYTVTPVKDKSFLNGVSTFDLVLISKHILGVQPLNSPYKMVAADVNNSKSITTIDLIQLRKAILGIDTKFANNTSWRFVDASYVFPNPANPWATQFPEVVNINDLAGDVKANFIGVKIGDVNGNAVASGTVRTAGAFNLNVTEQKMKKGNEYTVTFLGNLSEIDGYQFTMGFDRSKVELVNLLPGAAKEDNFGIFDKEGVITTSWNIGVESPRLKAESEVFTLVFRAIADANLSEVLNLNSRVTAAEAYSKGGDQLNVALNFTGVQTLAAGFELFQNTPNPFAGETVIGFNLPEAGQATLTIQDVTGRTLRVIRADYAKGYNQVTVKSNELNASGVLYYTVQSGEHTATKKLIILE